MKNVLDHSHPFNRFFEEIARIPHGSGNEKELSDYLVAFAEKHGFWCHQDEAWNVIIRKDASSGYESVPPVILQAHIDMVCEKVEGSTHDFLRDPIPLVLDGDILHADGTTLGADDAVGVALMLAVLEDESKPHPVLECVFTTEEETGMKGIRKLDFSLLQGRRVINLDNAGENETGLNAAGGLRMSLKRTVTKSPCGSSAFRVAFSGLSGGHTGCDCDVEKGNALKLMAHLLISALNEGIEYRLASVIGGSVPNAFPRDCTVELVCAERDAEKLAAILNREREMLLGMYSMSEPGITCTVNRVEGITEAFSAEDTHALVKLFYLLPHGVAHKSLEFENFTAASSNVGVVEMAEDCVTTRISIRGETDFHIDELRQKVEFLCAMLGIAPVMDDRYPCWRYQPESILRPVADRIMQKLWGKNLQCLPVHAGVELCYFAEVFPEMDALGIGPIAGNPHTPEEWLDIKSAQRMYDFLLELLAALEPSTC